MEECVELDDDDIEFVFDPEVCIKSAPVDSVILAKISSSILITSF